MHVCMHVCMYCMYVFIYVYCMLVSKSVCRLIYGTYSRFSLLGISPERPGGPGSLLRGADIQTPALYSHSHPPTPPCRTLGYTIIHTYIHTYNMFSTLPWSEEESDSGPCKSDQTAYQHAVLQATTSGMRRAYIIVCVCIL